MRDIMNLSYTWNGEEVSMRGFAEQFMSEIKQKDRTMEDAERIAKTFIEAVKADPENESSASLTLPVGVTQVGGIILRDSSSLAFPVSVKQVLSITLHDSCSLTLSEGVTRVGDVVLDPKESVIFPDGFVLNGPVKYSAKETNKILAEHQKKVEIQPDRKPERKTKAREIYDRLCQTGEGRSKGKKI